MIKEYRVSIREGENLDDAIEREVPGYGRIINIQQYGTMLPFGYLVFFDTLEEHVDRMLRKSG